jgi:hypothetical protein
MECGFRSDSGFRPALSALLSAACIGVFGCTGTGPSAELVRVDRLAQNVERAESVRQVKRLQETYAQYSQFGLWSEMAALFANDAEMIRGDDVAAGQEAIGGYFRETFGGGREGLATGDLHTQLVFRPLINVSADGNTARGRWWEWSLLGGTSRAAAWAGGIYENEYVRDDGVWKFARVHYYPMLAGSYEQGWRNVDDDQKIVPYHFTTDETGIPVPDLPADAPVLDATTDPAARLALLEQRIAVMNDEDQIRNLQNAYGYYVDRKMWDDVTDLFTDDAVFERPNIIGIFEGRTGIRRAHERMGPQGLKPGELNDHMQLDMIVSVAPGGHEARARGIEFALLGNASEGTAEFKLSVFENRYVRQAGVWRIREMRIFPLMRADYYRGWGKSVSIEIPDEARMADRSVPESDLMEAGSIPEFFAANPVTGKPVSLPEGTKIVGAERLLAAPDVAHEEEPAGSLVERIAEAERRLAVSKAWDGTENVSSAYGDYLDDLDFGPLAAIFAEQGNKEIPFTGFYVTRKSIAARDSSRGVAGTRAEPRPRTSLPLHFRTQPVIHVAEDGRSAAIRTRLFQPQSMRTRSMGFGSGMYHDQTVLENGVWRLWSVAIDEHYFQSAGYEGGWSGVEPVDPEVLNRQGGATSSDYPPDIPLTDLGERQVGFRGGPGQTLAWPSILPMWFHYRNPVSGREPELYWPDCVPCVKYPETSMTSHGYLLPPN